MNYGYIFATNIYFLKSRQSVVAKPSFLKVVSQLLHNPRIIDGEPSHDFTITFPPKREEILVSHITYFCPIQFNMVIHYNPRF